MGTETKFNCYIGNPSAEIETALDSRRGGYFRRPANFAGLKSTVPHIPIYVDEHEVIEGAKQILGAIRPHWNLNAVQFKKFTDGITNKLVGCFYTQTENAEVNNGKELNYSSVGDRSNGASVPYEENDDSGHLSDDPEFVARAPSGRLGSDDECMATEGASNVVLVRVYGSKTDLLIDRKAETKNIILLHSYGFAPSLYATFKNGLAYDFVPGVTLNTKSVLRPEVWSLVARRMAEIHRVVKPQPTNGKHPEAMLWKKVQSFLNLVPERFSDADKHNRLAATFLPVTRLRAEFEGLYLHLESLGSPLVFAHNDLLLGNVIYTESRQSVTFIDYEYADYNFQAFDIGNHFAEFAGVDEVDYSLYPGREFQCEWLRVYLQAYLRRAHVTDAEVLRLYVQVNQFVLASHFFWTIWSLIQAEHSTIDFDYVSYAFVRYNEYLAKRDVFLALNASGDS